MEFRLRIKLGDAAMETAADVAEALTRTAGRVKEGTVEGGEFGVIIDANGNTVGEWELAEGGE